jgi:hypothetical protein
MTAQRLFPRNAFAFVLDYPFAFGERHRGEHALAVYARTADGDPP